MAEFTPKAILAALGIIKNVPKEKLVAIVRDSDTLSAVEKASAERLVTDITDHWREGQTHAVPGAEEIKTGPSERSSGGGAEKMIGDYSRPAPQHGVAMDAQRLEQTLGSLLGYMKSIAETLEAQGKIIVPVFAAMQKAKEEDEEEEEEEQTEVVNISKKSAATLIARARKLLAKASAIDDEADAATDLVVEKTKQRDARVLRKKAGRLLGKARLLAYAAKAKDIKAEIRTIAASAKADVTVVEEEEEEEEEEAEKARRAAEAAAKGTGTAAPPATKGESPGNQADKQNKENGNQDDSALKGALADLGVKMKGISDALLGIGTLQTTVAGLMDVVAGKKDLTSIAAPSPIGLMKGNTSGLIDKMIMAVTEAADSGQLDNNGEMRARTLLSRADAVIKGIIPEQQFEDELRNAPHMVQQVFAKARAAA